MENKLFTIKDPEYWINQMHPVLSTGGIRYFEKKALDSTTLNAGASLDAEMQMLRLRIKNNVSGVLITRKNIEKLQAILVTIKNSQVS